MFNSLIRYCLFIFLFAGIVSCKQSAIPDRPTYAENIAPIIYKNCLQCHHDGGAVPFSFTDPKQVVKRARLIQIVTKSRAMPPWPADPTYSHFVDETVLSNDEIETIKRWVDQGSVMGDLSKLPPMPAFTKGSDLGKPDLVLKMTKAIQLEGDNQDKFFLVKIPYELPKDTFIRAMEFVPGNRKLVHHVNGHLIQYQEGEKKNVFEGEPFINTETSIYSGPDAYKKMGLFKDDNKLPLLTLSVVNYLPGVKATAYPQGIGGYRMRRKGDVFFREIHYGPTPVNDSDRSIVNIFFDKKPPVRPTMEIQLGTLGVSEIVPALIVPPNEVKTFRTQGKILNDISLLTINPHMHLLGKSFWAYAVGPEGDTIPLIRIKKWDFRWQYFYTFKHPVKLVAGTNIYVEGVYDNTVNNPNNPFNPPREIRERNGSMRTTDEMFQFIMTYLPYKEGDENIDLSKNSLK